MPSELPSDIKTRPSKCRHLRGRDLTRYSASFFATLGPSASESLSDPTGSKVLDASIHNERPAIFRTQSSSPTGSLSSFTEEVSVLQN
jgi:hypothetical protein